MDLFNIVTCYFNEELLLKKQEKLWEGLPNRIIVIDDHSTDVVKTKSPWGFVGGWVKSVIKPDYLKSFYGATIQYPDIAGKYYFEIFAQ